MSINKTSLAFVENPELNDETYSEKDKCEFETSDQDEFSSIKFGISKEEFEAFSNGTNLEIFERKDLKYKAKKLLEYVKNGEIKFQVKMRSLVIGFSTLAFCIILFLLVSNTSAHSQIILNQPELKTQEIENIIVPEEKLVKNDLNIIPSIEEARGVAEAIKEQSMVVKQTLNVEKKIKSEKIQELVVPQKEISKQENQEKKPLNLKVEQPKVEDIKTKEKESKVTSGKKIAITNTPKLENKQEKQKIEGKNNIPIQDMKNNKEKVAPAKTEDKNVEKLENAHKDKSSPPLKSVEKKKDSLSKKGTTK